MCEKTAIISMSGRGRRGGGGGGATATTTTTTTTGGGRGKTWVRGEPITNTSKATTSEKKNGDNTFINNNNNKRLKLSENTYSRRKDLNANASSFVPSVSFIKEQEKKKRELRQKLVLMEKQKEELKAKVEEAARLAKLKEEQEEERATKRFNEEQELKREKAKRAGNLLSGFKDSLKNKVDIVGGGEDTADVKKTSVENETKKQIERVLQAGTDWAVLNLPRGSKKKWLTQSYRELAKSLHPDKCALPRAKQAFQRVKEAYENLSKDAVE